MWSNVLIRKYFNSSYVPSKMKNNQTVKKTRPFKITPNIISESANKFRNSLYRIKSFQ